MNESAADLSPGQFFAGWRVERELARGGMGVLYLAHHPRLPRTDVIKVLSPWLSSNDRFRERFLREANRMSTLSHPHVMPIHDSGEVDDGTLYLVMPYISGGDLRGLLRRTGPLPPERAAKLIGQLASALDAAHRIGVVHRDVKPENVLLASVEPDDSDHALLTDFGISREQTSAPSLTATGELLLTPAYAAPEQVLGGAIDARADQYALACILYELLTGGPPYLNDVPVVMLMAHVQEPVPQLAARMGLPPAIDTVLARAMSKRPEQRYDSCRELAKAALAALAPSASMPSVEHMRGTLPAPPPRTPPAVSMPPLVGPPLVGPPSVGPPSAFTPVLPQQRLEPPRKRHRAVAVAAAVAVLAAAGAVIGLTAGGGGGGGSSKPSAAYQALLTRLPADVRGSCKDVTGQLAAEAKPYVITSTECASTVSGRRLSIDYRTLGGDAAAIKRYRTEVLQLGGRHHSPGNCMTFQSTDTSLSGTSGFAQTVTTTALSGALWCDKDGTLWYLQTAPASGQLPIITEVRTDAGNALDQAPQRFNDLAAVAPQA